MTNAATTMAPPKASAAVWTGRVLSGLFIAFMLFASVVPKFFVPAVSGPTMEQLGWPARFTLLIGAIELAGVVLYAIPRTAVLGAVLFTALLGGAIATQLRVENPLFSHVLFGVYMGLVMWGGLWLRNPRLRSLLPVVSAP